MWNIEAGKRVFVNSNHRDFCKGLEEILRARYPCKKILCLTALSPDKTKASIASDTDAELRMLDIFIASPVFKDGHSITRGIIDVTFSWKFTHPSSVDDKIQADGRARSVPSIFVWYEGNSSIEVIRCPLMKSLVSSTLGNAAEQNRQICESDEPAGEPSETIQNLIGALAAEPDTFRRWTTWKALIKCKDTIESTNSIPLLFKNMKQKTGRVVKSVNEMLSREFRMLLPKLKNSEAAKMECYTSKAAKTKKKKDTMSQFDKTKYEKMYGSKAAREQWSAEDLFPAKLQDMIPIKLNNMETFERQERFILSVGNLAKLLNDIIYGDGKGAIYKNKYAETVLTSMSLPVDPTDYQYIQVVNIVSEALCNMCVCCEFDIDYKTTGIKKLLDLLFGESNSINSSVKFKWDQDQMEVMVESLRGQVLRPTRGTQGSRFEFVSDALKILEAEDDTVAKKGKRFARLVKIFLVCIGMNGTIRSAPDTWKTTISVDDTTSVYFPSLRVKLGTASGNGLKYALTAIAIRHAYGEVIWKIENNNMNWLLHFMPNSQDVDNVRGSKHIGNYFK